MSHIEIEAPTNQGQSIKLSGTKVGAFLIHEMPLSGMIGMTDISTWRVTQISSGLRFPWDFVTEEAARAFAQDVELAADWKNVQIIIDKVAGTAKWERGEPSLNQKKVIKRLALSRGGVRQ